MYTAMLVSVTLISRTLLLLFFFFNDTATTEIYTLSLHDALPISSAQPRRSAAGSQAPAGAVARGIILPISCHGNRACRRLDRKSTRLNSSHQIISYAVFCLKKKKKNIRTHQTRKQQFWRVLETNQ